MSTYEFRRWCEKAVSGIIFPPDREKVYQELMNHMEDHFDLLLEQGIDEETARQMTVDAMGDAYEIAPQLAEIHRPFWGYFLRATRVMLVIAVLITLIPLAKYVWEMDYSPIGWASWDVFSADSYGGGTGRTLLHLSEPNISEKSGGYTYTVTDAVQWYNEEYDNSCFLIYMEEFHPLPWAEHDRAGRWFWAQDSLGTVYEAHWEHGLDEEAPVMYVQGYATGLFSCTYAMWINEDIPAEAEWIDIRYTRDGRNLVFRIDLKGVDGA